MVELHSECYSTRFIGHFRGGACDILGEMSLFEVLSLERRFLGSLLFYEIKLIILGEKR